MKVALVLFLCVGCTLLAGGAVSAAPDALQGAAASPGGASASVPRQSGTISGTVWQWDNTPIAHARVRLRGAVTGQVEMGTQADDTGRFAFPQVSPGSYVVELVDESGTLRAVGQMFSIGPGEMVATFIRLGAQVPWFSGFFSNAAAAVLATAASLGVTAVGDGVQPASPRQ